MINKQNLIYLGILSTLLLSVDICTAAAFNSPKNKQTDLLSSKTEDNALRPPRVLETGETALSIISMPDGSFSFINNKDTASGVAAVKDDSGNSLNLQPALKHNAENTRLHSAKMFVGKDGELYVVSTKRRFVGEEKRVAIDILLDIWFAKTSDNMSGWSEPKMIWEGYTGAIMEYSQLANGRILVPFGAWIAGCPCTPPIGCNETTAIYSDDNGKTWHQIKEPIQSPCYFGYNGNNYGACEPAIEQLNDGSIYMLMRSQTGFLYESYSYDNGETWTKGQASRFTASHGPPALFRDKTKMLVAVWNSCELPPRIDGEGVYGGRDALHIAVSSDEGKSWQGFREIYRDPYRNQSPPQSGDRGTAYPYGAFTEDGDIVVVSGQGEGRRRVIVIDPEWITAKTAFTDFSDAAEQWHIFKPFGKPKRWWRDRVTGCKLVVNPTNTKERCLHLRRVDSKGPDGAVWNFPNGWKATVKTRIMLKKGSSGAKICLNDRMFDPTDENGQRFSIFAIEFSENASGDSVRLAPDKWYDIEFSWNLSEQQCTVLVNGREIILPQKHKTLNGISYIRFNSIAQTVDTAGFLVDYVEAEITDNTAPSCTANDKLEAEETYRDEFMPFWNKTTGDNQIEPEKQKDDKSPVEVDGKVLG